MVKRIWKPLVFVLVIGGLATALYIQINSLKRPSVGIEIGELAPDFTGATLEGGTITLSDFRGQIVLVNDFTAWCDPCQVESSILMDVYNAEEGDVVYFDLNLQESEAKVSELKGQNNIPHSPVLSSDGLPTSWFIDSEGVVRYVHAGPMTAAMLQETLDAIREGRDPNVNSVLN